MLLMESKARQRDDTIGKSAGLHSRLRVRAGGMLGRMPLSVDTWEGHFEGIKSIGNHELLLL